MNLCNLSCNLNARDFYIARSSGKDRVSVCHPIQTVFYTWQCIVLLKFIISSRVKSAIETLVDKIDLYFIC